MAEKKILLIGDTKEYLFLSLVERLTEASYQIVKSDPDIDEINEGIHNSWFVVIYASDAVIAKTSVLAYIRDKVIERDLPLFTVGDRNQIDVLKMTIYNHLIEKEFYRPINITEMVIYLDDYMKHYEQNNRKRILVVDDSGTMLRNARRWLGDKYSVELANSGTMAIKNMTLRKPDLVLLDYEMPVVDGSQVFEMIKAEPDFEQIPVIFLTGKSDPDSVKKCLSLKPNGYLLKSMTPDEIVGSIDDFFLQQKLKQKGGPSEIITTSKRRLGKTNKGIEEIEENESIDGLEDIIPEESPRTRRRTRKESTARKPSGSLDSVATASVRKEEIPIEEGNTIRKKSSTGSTSRRSRKEEIPLTSTEVDEKSVDDLADDILANLGLDLEELEENE